MKQLKKDLNGVLRELKALTRKTVIADLKWTHLTTENGPIKRELETWDISTIDSNIILSKCPHINHFRHLDKIMLPRGNQS